MRAVGADAELLGQALAVEQPEDGLGVARIDGEEHAASLARYGAQALNSDVSPVTRSVAVAVITSAAPSPLPDASQDALAKNWTRYEWLA